MRGRLSTTVDGSGPIAAYAAGGPFQMSSSQSVDRVLEKHRERNRADRGGGGEPAPNPCSDSSEAVPGQDRQRKAHDHCHPCRDAQSSIGQNISVQPWIKKSVEPQ